MTGWIEDFKDLVEVRSGIRLSSSISDRSKLLVERRARALGLNDANSYLATLRTEAGRAEFEALLNLITVGKTSFFRHPGHIHAVVHIALPMLDKMLPAGRAIQIWSAACATGQEPYTLAMALDAAGWFERRSIRILGSDINTDFLAHARAGRYHLSADARDRLPALAHQYFDRSDGADTVVPSIRQRVRFERINLVHASTVLDGVNDIVMCANVLIYFSPETVSLVTRRLASAISANGILFVGAAESLQRLDDPLWVTRFDDVFAYAKGDWGGQLKAVQAKPRPSVRAQAQATRLGSALVSGSTVQSNLGPTQPRLAGELRAARARAVAGDRRGTIKRLIELKEWYAEDQELREFLAFLLFQERRFDDALMAFDVALESDPLAGDLHFYRGWLLRQRQDHIDAQAAFRKALFVNPDFAFARFELALSFHREGNFDAAIREYRRAEASATNSPAPAPVSRRAQIMRDAFWDNPAMVIDLSRRNRARALERLGPVGTHEINQS